MTLLSVCIVAIMITLMMTHYFRVSFYEVGIDDSVRQKQKSSGITVCTGTGSTSWFFNINHLTTQSVHDILTIGKDCNNVQ